MKINTTKTIIGSFIGAILIGMLLLMLPISNQSGQIGNPLTCLFTATSAMCVTGLVVVDTATTWTLFGQTIILILIQLGGLGLIFVSSIIMMIFGAKIGYSQQNTLQDALSLKKVGGILKLSQFILKGVILFELLGALFLFIQFSQEFSIGKAIYYSIFHSISAFCNAGFDLMGIKESFSSLTSYSFNILVNLTLISIIVIGGLGFTVWEDVYNYRLNFKKYALQSKIVIITSFILIILPALYFYFIEYKDLTGWNRIFPSLFQSVTTRTAGFNTMDYTKMSEIGKVITIMLMLVGGSPGSTAGGMKTTTIAILVIAAITTLKRQNEPHIFNKRISSQVIRNALTIFMLYLTIMFITTFIVCSIENCSFMEAIFECGSAIGTVGSSLSLTPTLSNISRCIIIFLMLFGRVGGLTFILAIVPNIQSKQNYLAEEIIVG